MSDINASIQLELSQFKKEVDDLGLSFKQLTDQVKEYTDTEEKINKHAEAIKKGAKEEVKDREDIEKLKREMFKNSLSRMEDNYKEFVSNLQKQGGYKELMAQMAPQQLSGLDDSIKSVRSSILSELPFGGLLGLMFLGGKRSEEIRAMGASLGRDFLQSGEVGTKLMSELGQQTNELGVRLGKGQTGLAGDIDAVAKSLSAAGVSGKEAMGEFAKQIDGVHGNIVMASFAIDSMFKLGSGTSAKMIGEITRDFNVGAKEATNIVLDFGIKARDTGQNVMSFSSSVMRASTALRSQAIDIREVAEAHVKFQKAVMESMNLDTSDPSAKRFAGEYASRAAQQITSAISGMDIGMSAVLGEKISQSRPDLTQGKQLQGLDAGWAFKTGFAQFSQTGEMSDFFKNALKQMGNVTKEAAGNDYGQQMQFLTTRMGVGTEGAQVITQLLKDQDEGLGINESIANHSKELNTAFRDRAAETSNWQKDLQRIQQGIATIGQGILMAVISGFQTVSTLIQIGIESASHPLGSDKLDDLKKYFAEAIVPANDRAFSTIMRGSKQLGVGVASAYGDTAGFGAPSQEEFFKHRRGAHVGFGVLDDERKKIHSDIANQMKSGETIDPHRMLILENAKLMRHHPEETRASISKVEESLRKTGEQISADEKATRVMHGIESLLKDQTEQKKSRIIKKSMPTGKVGERVEATIKLPSSPFKETEN